MDEPHKSLLCDCDCFVFVYAANILAEKFKISFLNEFNLILIEYTWLLICP